MQVQFEELIESYLNQSVGMTSHFMTDELSLHLKGNLERLFDAQQMKPAGTGNASEALQNQLIRSDEIYWLDRSHEDPHENAFFDLMDEFVLYLNRTCFTGITSYEFHYARYGQGAFYTKHKDQFRNQPSRKFSMIMYLNEGWQTGDGGELCIHQNGQEQHIAPEFGKGVFFRSDELEHEVLPTHKTRMSITGWLKSD